MANGTCDVCGARPATVRAQVVNNGQRQTMELCDVDYRRLARQQSRSSSPVESLFGGGGGNLFDDFFGGDFFGRRPFTDRNGTRIGEADEATGGTPIPIRSDRSPSRARPAGGISERLSSHAEEILQGAARRATDLGRREVDTEHLLYALADSDVVRSILDQFKLSTEDLRRQLDQEAEGSPGGTPDDDEEQIGVSPRVKDALSRAYQASRDFGHSYVWALFTGGLMLAAAFRLHVSHGRWWLVLSGVLSLLWGVLLVLSPLAGAVVLTWWLGIYAFVFGILLLALGVHLRRAGLTGAGLPSSP